MNSSVRANNPRKSSTKPLPSDTYLADSDSDSSESDLDRLLKSVESSDDFSVVSSSTSSSTLPYPEIHKPLEPPSTKFSFVHFVLIIKLYLIMTLLLFSIIVLMVFVLNDSANYFENNFGVNSTETTANETQQQKVPTFQLGLDAHNKYRLFWTVDHVDESVLFELRLIQESGSDWFAFGFSDYGAIEDADLCMIWFDKRGKLHFDDIKTDNESFVIQDQQSNDCRFIKAKRKGRVLRVAFRRAFDTCDPDDYVIDEGTTHLVYATGSGPISRIEGIRLQNHPHGFQRAQVLKPPSASQLPKLSSYVKKFEALNDNQTVPSVETTYWCRLIKLPDDFRKKTHIVQYEAVIQAGSEFLVHHMELFHCEVGGEVELPAWDGRCADPTLPEPLKACKRVIAAWAMGASAMTYPRHVGLPVGGANYSLYVMLEIHYNNPELRSGAIDGSGVRLYYTDHLRSIDAGILEVGLEYTDKNSIPPRTVMNLRGYCVSECTRAALPPYGITIFASQLHTHLTGVQTWTEHIRGGTEFSNINRDNHYSQHYQEIRKLKRPITVFPGDALIHVCRYNTRERTKMTLGGFGIRDEMCVNYIHYYPKTDLEVCKSSIDTAHLRNYFERMRIEEQQNTSATFPVSDNYLNIEWNAKRTRELDLLYQTAPLSMQCNQSTGERFPGYWNGMPLTRIVRPLKAKERKCRWTMRKANRDGTTLDDPVMNSPVAGTDDTERDAEEIEELVLAKRGGGQMMQYKRSVDQQQQDDNEPDDQNEEKILMMEIQAET